MFNYAILPLILYIFIKTVKYLDGGMRRFTLKKSLWITAKIVDLRFCVCNLKVVKPKPQTLLLEYIILQSLLKPMLKLTNDVLHYSGK